MDFLLIGFISALISAIFLIVTTLISLLKVGDERKIFIKTKAQSFAFMALFGFLIIEMGQKTYLAFQEDAVYSGLNPFSLLLTISITYLLSLLILKKKYSS